MNIKGVLLCGGEGTRLRPLTEVVNKHLIRVHHRPMAEYPLCKMIEAGIKEVLIVTGGENFAGVCKYFGSGSKYGISINYAIQDNAGGIAQALGLAYGFVGRSRVLVCLGDNLWNMNIAPIVGGLSNLYDCVLFAAFTKTPERFGVFKYEDGKIIDVVEKPKEFLSNMAAAGIYIYDHHVFEVIPKLKPSARGELEITDVNRYYIQAGRTKVVQLSGWWSDCGSIETLIAAEERIKSDAGSFPSVRT